MKIQLCILFPKILSKGCDRPVDTETDLDGRRWILLVGRTPFPEALKYSSDRPRQSDRRRPDVQSRVKIRAVFFTFSREIRCETYWISIRKTG